jgi:NAD(P)-dependent dehydrogenase (short-subunit alcohol dehydrogenase family)
VEQTVSEVTKDFGTLDVMVANAGMLLSALELRYGNAELTAVTDDLLDRHGKL